LTVIFIPSIASSVIDRFSRIWSQRHLSLTTKFRLYSSCILAVLLYACKTWTLTKSDWKRLESFHLRCQRRILGIKWSDFITNAEVYTRSGLQSIHRLFAGAVSHCSATLRACQMYRPKQSCAWHATSEAEFQCSTIERLQRRSRGRPPITWLHQICSDCGLSAGDVLNCAQDRDVWSSGGSRISVRGVRCGSEGGAWASGGLGALWLSPQRGPGAESLVGGSGRPPPGKAEHFL